LFSTPMGEKRLPMVPVLSSAARMPLPGATIALAVAISSAAYSILREGRKEAGGLERGSADRRQGKEHQHQRYPTAGEDTSPQNTTRPPNFDAPRLCQCCK
jgi:hypothetical protein